MQLNKKDILEKVTKHNYQNFLQSIKNTDKKIIGG